MHRQPHKLDKEATKAKNYHSRYSYVSRRIHEGTNHGCEYLSGFEDCTIRRRAVFERDGYLCVDCKRVVLPEPVPSWYPMAAHLAHGGHTKISRCWCMENLKTKCHDCHRDNDHHGRDF
jgi:hypothetical protein